MPGTLVNGPKTQMLDVRVSNPPFDTLVFGLLQGTVPIGPRTVFADLTEMAGTGYARQPITGWSGALLLMDNRAYSQADVVTFTNSGGTDWPLATGWFWFDATLARLVAFQAFALPFVVPGGQSWPLTPYDELTGE